MGVRQAGFELLFLLAFGLSEAQWQGSLADNQYPNMFGPRALAIVPQKVESRIPQLPQKSGTSSAVFTPPKLPSQYPVQTPVKAPAQDPMGVQLKEFLDGPMTPFKWSFPSLPEEPQQPNITFELRHPIPAHSVAAQCRENSVYVEVMEDFFGTGKLMMPSAFTLGGCAPTGEDTSTHVLIFEYELQGCGSVATTTEDALIYNFNLIYTPQEASSGAPVIRSSGVVVGVECHYPRLHNVSSNALMPSWVPYASTLVAEDIFVFSLRLMTDDWTFERPSHQYFLGDLINIEASVHLYNHVPVRVFVDSCVATTTPDVSSVPRYSFIENNGCLVDAKLTGSRSHFLPRTQSDKLQFQLEAFRFQQPDSGLVYITCVLKVAAESSLIPSPDRKACSFSSNGWVSADGSDQVCSCCDTTCSSGSASLSDVRWDKASVGPINIKKYPLGK